MGVLVSVITYNETFPWNITSAIWFDKVTINHEMSLKVTTFFETFLVIFGDFNFMTFDAPPARNVQQNSLWINPVFYPDMS